MRQILVFLALSMIVFAPAASQELTDQEIRKILIRQSIATYSGSCPCPYNTMRNGRNCGGNSAYSKPGGAEPRYYERDVSDEMVKRYRKSHEK